jgi:hypothetical protein
MKGELKEANEPKQTLESHTKSQGNGWGEASVTKTGHKTCSKPPR